MKKVISFYKAASIIDLILFTLGLGISFFYFKADIFIYIFTAFFYIFFLASAFIGYKAIKAIEKSIKVTVEYIIIGYVSNIIKLIITLTLLFAALYLLPFSSFFKLLLSYQLFLIGLLLFIFFSILNSIIYFLIVQSYKKIRELNIEDIKPGSK